MDIGYLDTYGSIVETRNVQSRYRCTKSPELGIHRVKLYDDQKKSTFIKKIFRLV